MEQRLSAITLGVRELRRARDFYETGLGWQPGFANDEVVFYQLGGIILALYARHALAADAGLQDSGNGGFGGFSLAYNVRATDEVDAVLDKAVAAGGTLLKAGHEAVWGGYTGYFADPDGHLWEVAWNPGWTIGADGSTRLTP